MFQGYGKAAKLKAARLLFMDAVDRDRRWQSEAREDFAFRDGFQWTREEKQILEAEMRPVLTMNLSKSSCDLIMGMNEDYKKVFRASPTDPTDSFLAEVLNDITDWINDRFDFEEEEDGALESAVICGRGYVGVDFRPDPDRFGEIVLQLIQIPVQEVHYDPATRRPKDEDASYVCWDRWVTRHDFQMRWPQVSNKQIDELIKESGGAGGITGYSESIEGANGAFNMPHDVEEYEDGDYDTRMDFEWYDRSKNMIRVVHMEYWEMFKRYFVFNPESGEFEEQDHKPTKIEKEAFFEEFGEEITVEEMTDKKVKWLIFAGDRILYDEDSPMPYKGFSIVPMFGFRDVSQRTRNHFGIIRLIKDPQKECNKRWSQSLNMLNQQVQTGIFAETDAFVDQQQAEQSMKEPGSITFTQPGALQGGKIQERNMPQFPSASMQMEEFSQDLIKKITGINPDLLGQDSGRREPGVVVKMRQQQGVTILRPIFNNFNAMKKELYKRILGIVMAYMPDKQILRILGQNERYTIDENGIITDNANGLTANIRDVRNLEYNIMAEPAPGNMSKRMTELQALLEMSDKLPVPPEQLIEKMDIPASEKAQWLEYINQQQQQAAQQQDMAIQMEVKKEESDDQIEREKNVMDFLVDISKLNQQSEKDEKKMKTSLMQMDLEEQKNIMESVTNMMDMLKTLGEDDDGKDEQSKQQRPNPA